MLHTSRLLSYAHLLHAGAGRRALLEPQARQIGLNRAESEQVLETLHTLGVADGWQPVGRKMIIEGGRDQFGASARPSLGYLYQHSTVYAEGNSAALKLSSAKPMMVEPKLVFSLGSTPEADDSLDSFFQRFDSVALALEILQNPFKGDDWTNEDKVCANGFHSKLVIGEPRTLSRQSRGMFDQIISNTTMTLNVVHREGAHIVGFGIGRDNIDQSLQHAYTLHREHVDCKRASPFAQGQWVAIGGWLPGKMMTAGQEWIAVVSGIELPSLRVATK
jgi:2-keto-4-pentenoate hydratase